MAISVKIDPNPSVLRHYDEPGPDSPREPGDQPDQKLRPGGARKFLSTNRGAKTKRPAARRRHR